MDRIRVALGDVPSAMSRDILAHITSLEHDIEFVGEVAHDNLQSELAALRADVLICEVQADELPRVSRDMFVHADAPVVVGLAREGRDVAVCVPNAGAAQLMSLIRAAVRGIDGSGKVLEIVRSKETSLSSSALPYASLWECVNDQLRTLDLALLAEVDAFEATTWEEGVQRLQGLAISPDEVRALLLKGSGPAPTATDELLRRQRLLDAAAQRIAATIDQPDAPPYVRLIERFHLDAFEQFCIIATLAVELDRNKYGKAYALLQDDVTRKQPSVELLLRLNDGLSQSERWEASRAFDGTAPLRRWNLLRFVSREAGDPATAFGRRVELDDRIGRFVLGLGDLGPQLEEIATLDAWDQISRPIEPPKGTAEKLQLLVDGTGAGTDGLAVHVHGPYGTGRRSLIAGFCRQRALRLIRVDASRLVALPAAVFDETLQLIAREPLLQPTAICLENLDALLTGDGHAVQGLTTAVEALRKTAAVLFILSHRSSVPDELLRGGASYRIGLGRPTALDAVQVWSSELTEEELDPGAGGVARVSTELASSFALSTGQIRDAARAARLRLRWGAIGDRLTLADLYQGCRDQCSHRLATLARHVTRAAGWPELVVPTAQANQLRELEAAIRNASGVLGEWNFASRLPYGRGTTALFSGPSGTGKTMAAGILANELGLDLYQIDLSRVVSKYIGETEKNLDRIFEEAEASNAVLFFDEADALFGKRSTIKDAHDRYANIEVAYLLQKMEEREGVTILATNLRANIDDAFMRRIRFVIEFPMPEYLQRWQIWRGALPAQARLAPDIDLQSLAKRYSLSGGSIVNICVAAASLAYAPDGAIAMKHLLHATKRELQKLGEQYREDEFSPESPLAPSGLLRGGV